MWNQEILQLGPKNATKILVGTKSNLRDFEAEEGHKIKERYQFDKYIEVGNVAQNTRHVF